MKTCTKCGHANHNWMDAPLYCSFCYEAFESKPGVVASSVMGLAASVRKIFSWKPASTPAQTFAFKKASA